MPFHLHTSNRLDRLAEGLVPVLRGPLASPFTPETVVVQSLGMARWLKLELARHLGVCAHLEFPFPRAFADRLLQGHLPPSPGVAPFTREVMQWRLFRMLGQLPESEIFAAPRRYLDGADPRKRLQLSVRLANLFDQYLVFRPDFIRRWDAGDMLEAEAWQAGLWRQIAAESATPHPARLQADFIAGLQTAPPENLPARLTLFGISALPPSYLDLFVALAAHTEVHCFLLQPCAEWWGDLATDRETERELRRLHRGAAEADALHLERGHRLLASLGPLGRDFLRLLHTHAEPVPHEDFVAPAGGSRLAALQRELLELREPATHPGPASEVTAPDDSIRVHNCHSPLREIEILRDHLLAWFQDDPTLNPRDVLVMTPDLKTYLPLVQAVFDSPEVEAERIPYGVADCGPSMTGPIAGAFLGLLQLAHGRLGATTVLDLLECPAVRHRFGLTETDLPQLREWIAVTRIRWGRDARHRESLGLPATEANTWRAGLRRMLLGYALPGAGEQLFADTLPYDDIEGGPVELLGRLAEFTEHLFTTVERLEQPHAPAAWITLLHQLLADFFTGDADTAAELLALRTVLAAFGRQLEAARLHEPLPLAVVLEPLAAALDEDTSGAGFLTGGVTFCALKPMRSIPFRIICLLGMNDGGFPRQPPRLGFDLMAAEPRAGDRSTRDDDRYLFLETLVSARERLHLSYVGQSIRDNSPAPPSVVVSELLDHLESSSAPADPVPGHRPGGTPLVVTHRLHAFSPAYFSGRSPEHFSFSRENCDVAEAARAGRRELAPLVAAPLPEAAPERRQITLRQLAEFLAHPAKFFLRERLALNLPGDLEVADDQEPFELDSLSAYALRQRAVAWRLAGRPVASLQIVASAEGLLPHGAAGPLAFHTEQGRADRFVERLQACGPLAGAEPVAVELALTSNAGDFCLTGLLTPRARGGLLHHRCAQLKAKDLLKLWVEHLAWNAYLDARDPGAADSSARRSLLIAEDVTLRFLPVPAATRCLSRLVEHYWQGLREPLPFFPRTARALVETARRSALKGVETRPDAFADASREWEGDSFRNIPGERDDPWVKLAFRHTADPLDARFEELAREVFDPLFWHTVEEPEP